MAQTRRLLLPTPGPAERTGSRGFPKPGRSKRGPWRAAEALVAGPSAHRPHGAAFAGVLKRTVCRPSGLWVQLHERLMNPWFNISVLPHRLIQLMYRKVELKEKKASTVRSVLFHLHTPSELSKWMGWVFVFNVDYYYQDLMKSLTCSYH